MRKPLLLAIALLTFGLPLYLYSTRDEPILVAFDDPGSVHGWFVIANPFRDRSPEEAAESELRRIRDGDLRLLQTSTTQTGLVERERRNRSSD